MGASSFRGRLSECQHVSRYRGEAARGGAGRMWTGVAAERAFDDSGGAVVKEIAEQQSVALPVSFRRHRV
jgi:hypothetical protein